MTPINILATVILIWLAVVAVRRFRENRAVRRALEWPPRHRDKHAGVVLTGCGIALACAAVVGLFHLH